MTPVENGTQTDVRLLHQAKGAQERPLVDRALVPPPRTSPTLGTTLPSRSFQTLSPMLGQLVNKLAHRDDAQDLLEHALLVALIALIAVGAVTAAGVQVDAIFQQIAGAI